jgi:16S rRNA A1518/A1519 N6-dimethyltransferase RsmA/KsgA/DIM1 with predicted DNA glycosylase/AP lyase activity
MLKKLLVGCGDVARAFADAGVALTARAEELSLDQWITLANELR